MKKFVKYILIFCSVLATTGCNFLDQDPEDLNSIDKVFSNKTDTRKWFARIYSDDYFPKELAGSAYYNHYMFGHDDANNALDWHIPVVLQGMISPEQTTGAWTDVYYFENFYKAIRHCNIFLENVHKCTELGQIDSDRMIAEARFMRAMYHFWILREYGPIPIMRESVQSEDAGLKIERNTLEECVEFIISEIDAAIPGMYETRTEEDFGFPTKGAALAMKARVLLTVASPLYNGNKTYANWRNEDGTVLMPMEYDAEKWRLAAEAAKVIIDMPQYKLLTPQAEDGEELTFQDYVDNYRAITTTYNDELIWACPQSTDWWCQQCWPAVFKSWNARDAVTLNLANAYYMADGSRAPELESWFENKAWSTEDDLEHGTQKNTFMMFVGREPRFYASNHFPNQYISYATNTNPDVWQTIEFWYEGNSGLSKSSGDHNTTGLSPRKNIPMDATTDKSEGKHSTRYIPFPTIRLGEIYLNYCEAMNEYYGEKCHGEILPYLRAIRERAGIGVGVIEGENKNVDQLLAKGSFTKEEMRQIIRDERRVELAWEVSRYFDVRRWFIAHGVDGVLNTPVYGFDVSQGKHATDPAFFTMKEGIPRIFRIEHYFAPVSASECAFNTKLVQAPFY